MQSTEPLKTGFRFRKRYVVIIAIVCLPLFCAIHVAGYFRLSSETQALRASLTSLTPGEWHKKFAVHVGSLPLCVVRIGSRFFNLPPEPRAVLDAVRGAEVGIYTLKEERSPVCSSSVLVAADKTMASRGWQRVVGVSERDELVAIYIPRKRMPAAKLACCLMVLQGHQLVLASARGNAEPLLEIARQSLHLERWHEGLRNELTCNQ